MVDIPTTASRIYGMVVDPQATLARNSQPVPPWHVVAKEHALPLIVSTALLHAALTWLLRPLYEIIARSAGVPLPELGNPGILIALRTITQFAEIFVWALVIGFFARSLGGRSDFNAAYLLAALAMTPFIVASSLNPIPVFGTVLWLCGLVYAVIIMYRGVPALVGVPEENRAKHLALSITSMLMAGLAVRLILGPIAAHPAG